MKIYILSFVLVALVISGCGSHKANTQNGAADINQHNAEPFDPAKHVISIDPDGKLKPCKKKNTYLVCEENGAEQDTYIKKIIAEIETFKKKNAESELLLFVHGGLNTEPKALERAQRIYKKIRESNCQIYPIFILWKSGGLSTYKDHLWNIRQGEEEEKLFTRLTSPVYFISDVGNSIVNIPKSWLVTGKHLWDNGIKKQKSDKHVNLLKEVDNHNKKVKIKIEYNKDPQDNISRNIRWILTSPAKAITTPFAYTMPKSAWDIMLRRTVTLFYTPGELQNADSDSDQLKTISATSGALSVPPADLPEFNPSAGAFDSKKIETIFATGALPVPLFSFPESKQGNGALSIFLQKLHEWQNSIKKTMPITLVGHSMGAIVVDNIILQEPKLSYKNIVHLASADSVSNVFNVITTYIKHKLKEKKECEQNNTLPSDKDCEKHSVRFYSLMLHPDNEDREEAWNGFVPSGSLLTWIDNMYTSPKTLMDRRSGRWDNIKKVIKFIPDDVANNMHFKIFGIKNDECEKDKECLIPQKHGDFDEIALWREETWK